MAIDFPSSPSVGDQVIGPYGEVYTWDGVAWSITAASGNGGGGGINPDDFVLKAGDTMTGPLAITDITGTPGVVGTPGVALGVESAVGSLPSIRFHTPPYVDPNNGLGATDDVVWEVVSEGGYSGFGAPSPLSVYGTINGGARTLAGQFFTGGVNANSGFTARGYASRSGVNSAATTSSNLWNISYSVADGSISVWVGTANLAYILPPASDYRTKKDVTVLPSMWDRVKELRPVSYTRAQYTMPGVGGTIEADDIERWGFLAHELQETLVPTVATGVKDEPESLQRPDPLTVIAALTKALQEAMARIEALEAKAV